MAPPPRATGATDRRPLKAKRLDSDTVELDLEGTDFLGALLGLVSKVNAPERLVRPFLTWALAATFLALWFLPTVGDWVTSGFGSIGETRDRWVAEWGFVPEAIVRQGGLTFVTSFFLHGGFFHAFFNACFLLLTGEDLEGRLGRVRFVALLLAATLLGDLFDAATRADRSIPAIGASGSIPA
jgi:membrane associated rhomboid family serine protease